MNIHPIPPTFGVTEFRSNTKEILDRVRLEPVLLSQHNRPTAMLIDVELWNEVVERLSELEAVQTALERLQEAKDDPSQIMELDEVKTALDEGALADT